MIIFRFPRDEFTLMTWARTIPRIGEHVTWDGLSYLVTDVSWEMRAGVLCPAIVLSPNL